MKQDVSNRMDEKQKSKRDDKLVRICPELYKIFDEIRENIQRFSWGIDAKISNYHISKVLAKRINEKKTIVG